MRDCDGCFEPIKEGDVFVVSDDRDRVFCGGCCDEVAS